MRASADYYGPYDAQDIFDELWDGALHTQPLKIGITFFCKKCDGMATEKNLPARSGRPHLHLRHPPARNAVHRRGIPTEFSRPEVVAILKEYYSGL